MNNINKNKILILGSKGNLGGQLVNVFKNDYNLICFDHKDIDITNKKLLVKKINNIKPDIIINAVAYNAVDKCEESEQEFELAKKINGEVVSYLSDIAILNKALFIHYSSDYVFDGNKVEGYLENDKTNPINNYGKTKLMGEQEILKRQNNNLKYYLIRTSKLFGPKGNSEFSKSSFFDIMLKLSKERDSLDVVDEEISCFTYTVDLAKATKKLIEDNKKYGIYHIVNKESATWYGAVKELFKITNSKIKINPVSSDKFLRLAKRPKHSILLNTKFEQLRNWKDALKEYLTIYL